jgi:hypothetical protein
MPSEFDRNPDDPQNESSSRFGEDASKDDELKSSISENEFDDDPFESREPNTPPRGLMRKRRHPIVWIGLALLLGGLIALVLSALITD